MNKTNKVLLHIGMIAAISGISPCYAAEDAPKKDYIDGPKCHKYRSNFTKELLLAGPLPEDAKVGNTELFGNINVQLPGCDPFAMTGQLDHLRALNRKMQVEFLNKYADEWLPLLFQKLDASDQRKFAEKHAQELQALRVEYERTASAWHLSGVAERMFADNAITVVNDHEVRLSKPLEGNITPDLCKAIIYYKITDRGNVANIFGQGSAAGYILTAKKKQAYFEYKPDDPEFMRKYPQGRIVYTQYGDYTVPNINLSEDKMTITWNPVLYNKDGTPKN